MVCRYGVAVSFRKVSIISVINDIANIMNKIQTSTFVQTKNAIRFIFLLKIYHANFIFQTKAKRFLCTFHKNRPAAILRFSALFSLLIEYMVSNYGSLYDAVILSEIQAAHRNIAV